MARSKKKAAAAKKAAAKKAARKPLERVDHHMRPAQGTHPFTGRWHPHQHPEYGAWHPFAMAPGALSVRAGGESGFTTGAYHMAGPFAGVAPRGYARSDQRVLEDVCDRLTLHGELDVRHVEVHCRDGVIRLEGTAPDRRTRRLIEAVADEVPGVVDVENELTIAPAAA